MTTSDTTTELRFPIMRRNHEKWGGAPWAMLAALTFEVHKENIDRIAA